MAKLRCPCGNVLSNVSCPSKNNGWFLRDVDVESDRPKDPICDGKDVWECDNCGRIAFGGTCDKPVKWFAPASGKYESICAWGDK